ncbi:DUF7563 family protein [Halobellus limi]|uniref:Small CPxCG-related zinc finger protein n=1 Tax=Halobellus limi TaxID=699433 RepID=A0A1H5SML4_9EURY|nr:hypothetical protein [Halobellus limi]QCC47545.1 hypothetical protein DV707_07645 [Halobellus limi]SEF51819.1 hypothetical protein SAMN04488133_0016 [Halobellus limi]
MMHVVRDRPEGQTACACCGAHVTDDFRRVFGDENDVAHRCLACDCRARIQRGSAAGTIVDLPDPQDHPNRNRGRRVHARTDGGDVR